MDTKQIQTRFKVLETRYVSDSTFVLRFNRNGLQYKPGQYLTVGVAGDIHMREYSIYSGMNDDFLEILVKKIEQGHVSQRLGALKKNAGLQVDGPFGFFTIPDDWKLYRFMFIATGTGIAPFHNFITTYPDIDYTLLHGVRYLGDLYEHHTYQRDRVIRCISREKGGDYHGRLTDYLRTAREAEGISITNTLYYLCGNCDMIYETFDMLQDAGLPHEQMFAEVYF